MTRRLLLLSALTVTAACLPQVKPDAFIPPKKLAIVVYESEGVHHAMFGVGAPVGDVGPAYAALKTALAGVKGLQVVDDSVVTGCPLYASIPPPPPAMFDLSSSAPGLKPMYLTPELAHDLAAALQVDLVVMVHTRHTVKMTAGIGGFGAAHLKTTTTLAAFDTTGQRVWYDSVITDSDNFGTAGGMQSPDQLQQAAAGSMSQAGAVLAERLTHALGG